MEFLLIAVVALLAFLCVTGEIKSFKGRRQADPLIRQQAGAKRLRNGNP